MSSFDADTALVETAERVQALWGEDGRLLVQSRQLAILRELPE